ncbi:alpha/beta fold hydrolase [Intrasporangium mesophilum]
MRWTIGARDWPRRVTLRDVSLFVDLMGTGEPLVLMHGGPSADLWTLGAFRRLANEYTLVFYDHRCNGRSTGAPVSSMSWDNLTADADTLRKHLGFETWAVLGHSFGGNVALEYALRYPDHVSRLLLVDTGADSRWAREVAPEVLARRGYPPDKVELVRRWFRGDFSRREYYRIFWRIGDAYSAGHGLSAVARELAAGGWRSRIRPEAFIYASRHLLHDWSVADRLGEITVPTLVLAGLDDFVFPPECQRELADGIPRSELVLIEQAGHNPHDERPDEVMRAVRSFLASTAPTMPAGPSSRAAD